MANHYTILYHVRGEFLLIEVRATSDRLDQLVLRKRLGREYGGSVTFTQRVKKDDPKARDKAEKRARAHADAALNKLIQHASKARGGNP